eukprot:2854561-Pyramimonas_sp.AAC.2
MRAPRRRLFAGSVGREGPSHSHWSRPVRRVGPHIQSSFPTPDQGGVVHPRPSPNRRTCRPTTAGVGRRLPASMGAMRH